MLTVTQNLMLPTAITGSYPRPLWFDLSLNGRSFKSALGDLLFREQYLDAVAAIINAQEAAGLDIVTDGDSRFDLAVGRQVLVLLSDRAHHRHRGPSRHLARLDEPARPAPGQDPVGGAGGVSARRGEAQAERGPLEYTAIWQVAQRMTDRPVKFGAICAPALASMLWNEYYHDDKQLVLDLCDIMNAEFREMADAGCPLIQVEEPPHHGRSTRPDCTEADLEFLTEAFNRQLVGVNAEIWVHTCWGNPNQQRVYWEVPSYERAMPYLLQLNGDVITFECASSDGRDLHAVRQVQDRQEDRHRRGEPLQHRGGAAGVCRRTDPPRAGVHPARAAGDHHRLRLRPRGPEPAHRALQVRLDGGGHQHRAARTGAAGGACARGGSQAVLRHRRRG